MDRSLMTFQPLKPIVSGAPHWKSLLLGEHPESQELGKRWGGGSMYVHVQINAYTHTYFLTRMCVCLRRYGHACVQTCINVFCVSADLGAFPFHVANC